MSYSVVATCLSAMEKVLPSAEPSLKEEYGSALLGEEFHFQIAFQAMEEFALKHNHIEIRSALQEYISIQKVDYAPATAVAKKYIDDYYLSRFAGLYPDILKPVAKGERFVLPHCTWQYFYITVKIPTNFSAGEYPIEFVLIDENGEEATSLTYRLEIIGEKMVKPNIPLTNWIHCDCIANYYQVPVFSKAWYDIFDKFLRSYVENGYNMLLVPLFTPPLDTAVGGERLTTQLVGVYKEGEEYRFDFSKLDEYIRFAFDRGIRYLEFSHLFTQWGGKFCPKIMLTTEKGEEKLFGWETPSDSVEYVTFLEVFLKKLTSYIVNNGWKDISFFHLTDEPQVKDIEYYEKCCKAVKPYLQGMPTMDAISEYEFYEHGLVDWIVPSIHVVERFKEKGLKDVACYYCCSPSNGYFSNRHLNMPLQRARILGMQLYLTGARAFLHWGFNFYNTAFSFHSIDPYLTTDAGGFFPSGDSFIVYPAKDGVLETLRLKTLLDGFQDYGALCVLEKYKGRAFVEELMKKEHMAGYYEYKRSADWHRAFRYKINTLIKEAIC